MDCIKIINDMLLKTELEYDTKEWAILVHVSIVKNFKKMWHKFSDWKTSEYTIQIGSKCYEMFLVRAKLQSEDNVDFLQAAIKNSQFSFVWKKNPNLFINAGSFNILKKFIRIHNLQAYISNIEEERGISTSDEIIKVVTFNNRVSASYMIKQYVLHLNSIESYHRPEYYYMTHAFPWLQPLVRQHFNIPISDECYSVFPIIFNHLQTLSYIRELNIFDLLTMRLALCDDRNPSPSNVIKSDIDFMIRRKLTKIIKNNHLDLDQYLIATNYEHNDLLSEYLIYEFHRLFEIVTSTNLDRDAFHIVGYRRLGIYTVIKLAPESDVLNVINEKYNIMFEIDGSGYDRMSLSLFLDLIECKNVVQITLDSNYRFFTDECNLTRSISNLENIIHVELIGTNTYNFIEEFISSLKTVTFQMANFEDIGLHIKCILNDYSIFDNLTISAIMLYNILLDTHMLEVFHKCNLKSKINVWHCTFENKHHNWALLNHLKELDEVLILEDEGTWQSLFEFIVSEMLESNSKEFQFNNLRYKIISEDTEIGFSRFKYTFDELKSKLEIRNRDTNEIIDLFEEKFSLQTDKKFDYDFYK